MYFLIQSWAFLLFSTANLFVVNPRCYTNKLVLTLEALQPTYLYPIDRIRKHTVHDMEGPWVSIFGTSHCLEHKSELQASHYLVANNREGRGMR